MASPFVQLETLPKARYHKQHYEVEFYKAYFEAVSHWASNVGDILLMAETIASQYGLAAMDALHVAAARSVTADELITIEHATKPMFRVTDIRIISLYTEV